MTIAEAFIVLRRIAADDSSTDPFTAEEREAMLTVGVAKVQGTLTPDEAAELEEILKR